jgi:hypothetical protein
MPASTSTPYSPEVAGRSVLRSSDARSFMARCYEAGFLMQELRGACGSTWTRFRTDGPGAVQRRLDPRAGMLRMPLGGFALFTAALLDALLLGGLG